MASIQNACNLPGRTFEVGLAEIALREYVGLRVCSPLPADKLSGKYTGGVMPSISRRAVAKWCVRYDTEASPLATERYVALAHLMVSIRRGWCWPM